MKKTIGVILIAMGFSTSIPAQDISSSTLIEKRDLHNEKRQINKEEKSMRKEERTERREEVTYQTREEFRSDFPDAQDVGYMVGTNFDEVAYRLGGRSYTAYYNNQAELIGTTSQVKFNELPADARREITRKYLDKGYNADRVILFDDNELVPTDMWLYDRAFDDADNYFIELSKLDKKFVLEVDMRGNVSFYRDLK